MTWRIRTPTGAASTTGWGYRMTADYTIEDMEAIMRAEVDVYEVRDPDENRRRHEH